MQKVKEKRHNIRLQKIMIGVATFAVSFCLIMGFAAIILYKSGENSIKANAGGAKPNMITSIEEEDTARKAIMSENVIAWQDGWVSYGNDVFAYDEDALNFLIIGIDHGGELNKITNVSDWSAGQADTIFLISLHKKTKSISVIGVPRNSMVTLDVYNEEEKKIDSIYNQICLQYAYAGGGELGLKEMENSVSTLFYGLPIHGACAMSFDAIGEVAERIGGIDIVLQDDLTDCNKNWQQGTTLRLNKSNIMDYLRYRGTAFKSSNVRLGRQKLFMEAAMKQGINKVKENPKIVTDIYKAILPYINTDITSEEATYLAVESLGYTMNQEQFYQLSGENVMVPMEEKLQGEYDYYDDFYVDEDALKKLMIDVYYQKVSLDTHS